MKTILTANIKNYDTKYLLSIQKEIEEELDNREKGKIEVYEKQLNDFLKQMDDEGYAVTVSCGPSPNNQWKMAKISKIKEKQI